MEWGGERSQRPQQWGWTCELGRARELPGSLEREEDQSAGVFRPGKSQSCESRGWGSVSEILQQKVGLEVSKCGMQVGPFSTVPLVPTHLSLP